MKQTRALRLALALLVALVCACPALGEEADMAYIENEWNYADGSIDPSAGIPEDATGRLKQIRERGILKVATEPEFAPQEFIDPDRTGQDAYVGADMEMARRIAQRMGVELEIVPMAFSEVPQAVIDGRCDLAISGLAYTPARAEAMTLSKGYHYAESGVQVGLLIRSADAGRIACLEDLAGLDLAAQSSSLQELLLAQNVRTWRQFRRMNAIQSIYRALKTGVVDAAAVDAESALLYIASNPDCGLELVPGVSFSMEPQFDGDRVAAAKGETMLVYFVNGVIDELLETGEYEQWYRQAAERASELGL